MAKVVEEILKSERGKQAHSLMHGYIREYLEAIKVIEDIPDVIIIECLRFYFQPESVKRWPNVGQRFKSFLKKLQAAFPKLDNGNLNLANQT